MGRWRYASFALLLVLAACRSIGAAVVTPTPVPAATSYVAPLYTVEPMPQVSAVPTPQPEEITPPPSIITVEPAADTTTTATARP